VSAHFTLEFFFARRSKNEPACPLFERLSSQSARLRRRPMAAEEPLPATAGSLTCVPPPLNLPPAVKTRPAGRGIRFRRSSRNLDTASEQSSRETELEPAAEGQAATAEGAAAGQSPCGGSGTARRRRGAGGASPATPGEEDSHHRLSDAHIAYFEDQERLFRQRPQLDGKSRAVTDGRRASSRVPLRESLESGDQIDLGYYDPAARHYAWVKYAHQTGDWRMRLQLFLEDWQSSPGATSLPLSHLAPRGCRRPEPCVSEPPCRRLCLHADRDARDHRPGHPDDGRHKLVWRGSTRTPRPDEPSSSSRRFSEPSCRRGPAQRVRDLGAELGGLPPPLSAHPPPRGSPPLHTRRV